jgi:hypothetical protein
MVQSDKILLTRETFFGYNSSNYENKHACDTRKYEHTSEQWHIPTFPGQSFLIQYPSHSRPQQVLHPQPAKINIVIHKNHYYEGGVSDDT